MLCYFSYCARTSLLAQNSAQSTSASTSASTALPGSIRFAFFRKFYYTQGGHAGGRNASANGDGDVDDAANALTRFACVRWPQSFYIRPELNIVIKFMLLCYRYRYKIYSCTAAKALFANANLSTGSALPRLASTRLASPRLDWISFNGNRECSNYRFQCRV